MTRITELSQFMNGSYYSRMTKSPQGSYSQPFFFRVENTTSKVVTVRSSAGEIETLKKYHLEQDEYIEIFRFDQATKQEFIDQLKDTSKNIREKASELMKKADALDEFSAELP